MIAVFYFVKLEIVFILVYTGLSLWVPFLDCDSYSAWGVDFVGECFGKHHFHIWAGQERHFIFLFDPGVEDKMEGHHGQGDAVVPSPP